MEAVLAEARSRGVRDVRLEVITENERAIPLYERLGFERTRGLELWLLPGAAGPVHEIGRRATRTHGSGSSAGTASRGSATTARSRTSTT